MKKIFKNYKSTIILLVSIIIGAIIGIIFKKKTEVLAPLGELFLNMLFVVIVPLIFLTISTSIAKMKEPKRLGRVIRGIVIVFVITSLVSVFTGLLSTYSFNFVNDSDGDKIKSSLVSDNSKDDDIELNILDRTVSAISVDDFSKILSRDNVLAIVVFSILFGIAIRMSKDKGKKVLDTLISFNEVILKLVQLITYYAPIGLGCYTAVLVGTFGSSIAYGYLKVFVLYTIVTILFFVIVYSIYAYIAGGKKGLASFWKNVIPVSLTALATCSSAACIPVNIEASKKIGVSEDIADTIVPMGTSFHKDGSIIGSVFKIMFLVCLFNTGDVSIVKIIGIALLANLLITAVPVGGGTISESLIISMLGYPMAALPILTVIATIIDPGATMLNVVGDTSSSMLCARIVDGKDWINKKKE